MSKLEHEQKHFKDQNAKRISCIIGLYESTL